MPPVRPGNGHYATLSKELVLKHGGVCEQDGFVGVAVKQKARGFATGTLANQAVIDKNEKFFIVTKGLVTVDTISGLAVGDKVWIIVAENKLTETEGSNAQFGRVSEIAGERGCPVGKVRIDLDAKDSF